MSKSTMSRDWSAAITKVEEEGRCRVCGATDFLDAAHVIGRKHDPEVVGPRGGKKRFVHPDSIVPLCGAFSENFCHGEYDQRRLDLLPYLNLHEQIRAVEDAGGIELARNRICGSSV